MARAFSTTTLARDLEYVKLWKPLKGGCMAEAGGTTSPLAHLGLLTANMGIVQASGKSAEKQASASNGNVMPLEAAYVGIGALLVALIFYTFHCIWVSLSPCLPRIQSATLSKLVDGPNQSDIEMHGSLVNWPACSCFEAES